MDITGIKSLLREKESIHLEFKKSQTGLPDNVFETISSMLNREGGDIILGVNDDGIVEGIDERFTEKIKKNLVNLANNPQKLDPPILLFPRKYVINEKEIIHVQIPESKQLHKTGKNYYDRSNDGDYVVQQLPQLVALFNHKYQHHSESYVYPYVTLADFKQSLFPKVRRLIENKNPKHPWLDLDDESMLKSAGLWRRDEATARSGYTLAAVLLFETDELIQNILPCYKVDTLVRIKNMDRYDDRHYIRTNLIEAHDHLMDFVEKHLPDPFHLEGTGRISLRNKIFREVICNLLAHREYMDDYPSTFIIYKDRVEIKNANIPNGDGPLDPRKFVPHPKNPLIAKFFIQIGWVDELGSGVRNTTKYIRYYAPNRAVSFVEGAVFMTTVPVPARFFNDEVGETINDIINGIINDTINDTVNDTIKQRFSSIIRMVYLKPGIKVGKLVSLMNVSRITIIRDIKMLSQWIVYKGSSKTGGYFLEDTIKARLDIVEDDPDHMVMAYGEKR